MRKKLREGLQYVKSVFFEVRKMIMTTYKGKVAQEPRRPTRPELNPVAVAWSIWEYCCSPLDGMLVHRRVNPQQYVAGTHFVYLGGETQCGGKVSCLRKQHNGRDWASNHRPSDLKSNTLTTTPPRSHDGNIERGNYAMVSKGRSWHQGHLNAKLLILTSCKEHNRPKNVTINTQGETSLFTPYPIACSRHKN